MTSPKWKPLAIFLDALLHSTALANDTFAHQLHTFDGRHIPFLYAIYSLKLNNTKIKLGNSLAFFGKIEKSIAVIESLPMLMVFAHNK